MIIITKKELVEELTGMLDEVVNKCSDDMLFHANIEFSGIDPNFMEISKQYNIKKEAKRKAFQKQIRERGQI